MTVFAMILSLNNLLNETTRYWKIILIICFFLQFILLVLAQTRSSFIPFCLAVVILFINYKKALIALFGILLMVVSFIPLKTRLVSYSHPLIALRVGINYHTYEIIKDYPIIGIGFGMETFKNALDLKTYHKRVPEKFRENLIYDDPHNMFFDIAVRLGIVGFVLFFYIIFVFFKMCWDIIKYGKDDFAKNWGRCLAAALFSFLFIGYFHPVLSHMPETILCSMFSMLTIVWRFNNEPISNDVV
jgi:O-antigen ligase